MNKVLEEIGKIGIVPVIALEDVKDAKPLAKATPTSRAPSNPGPRDTATALMAVAAQPALRSSRSNNGPMAR